LAEAAVPMDTAEDSISCLTCTPRPWFPVVVIGQPLARNLQLINIVRFQQNGCSSLLVTVDCLFKSCWSISNFGHVGFLVAHSNSRQDVSMRKTVTWLVCQDSGCNASKPGHNLLCFGITKKVTNSRSSSQVVMTELSNDCSSIQL